MNKNNNKYRLTLYLGKENYEKLSQISEMLSIPLSTTARILLETGLQIGEALEKGVNIYGIK